MAAAVLCWTAGFDILYACQDFDSDRETGVVSVPAKVGIARALWISRATHLVCVGLLIVLGMVTPEFSTLYFIGVAVAAALLIYRHRRGGACSRRRGWPTAGRSARRASGAADRCFRR